MRASSAVMVHFRQKCRPVECEKEKEMIEVPIAEQNGLVIYKVKEKKRKEKKDDDKLTKFYVSSGKTNHISFYCKN